MGAAVAFYRDVVGLTLVRREGDEWAEFEAGPVRLALHGTDDALPAAAPVVFRVDDLEATRWRSSSGGPCSTSTWARSRGSRGSPRSAIPTGTPSSSSSTAE